MTTMTNFVGLSAVLTGFNQTVIAPSLDPVDIKKDYLAQWTTQVNSESDDPTLTNQILTKYATLAAQTPALTDQQIGEAMLDESNGDAFVLACRQLIFLWYMGAWPTLIAPTDENKETTNGSTVSSMLSSKSYTSGLVWRVMQAHPMGDSKQHYGYWSTPPVSLDDYTGNTSD